ncbi:hypothetical protein GCM10010166_11570 [Couchioplanes caeruleus subsp. azureus]|nr:hypothetical protein GCM10010166_11570 [Couchioplanes caeruleus subsp. azureus]
MAACSLIAGAVLGLVPAGAAQAADTSPARGDEKPMSDIRIESAYFSRGAVVLKSEIIVPRSVSRKAACHGSIVAVVRRDGAVVGKKRLSIMKKHLTNMHTCWISGNVPAAGGNKGLRITVTFGGNDKMGPSQASGKVLPRVPRVGS